MMTSQKMGMNMGNHHMGQYQKKSWGMDSYSCPSRVWAKNCVPKREPGNEEKRLAGTESRPTGQPHRQKILKLLVGQPSLAAYRFVRA